MVRIIREQLETKSMKRRALVVLTVAIAFLIFILPIQPAIVLGGVLDSYVHFVRSPSCSVFGVGAGYYSGTGLSDCRGPIIP
ncbi:MAG: hypothetical protein JRN20_00260 [Nitrososphaerota archaeon]|nr:hypothetical protein [Nitrososphaerota archaeon]